MRKGCFVYRVTGVGCFITVRSAPSRDEAYKTTLNAKSGNLVSIDCIIDDDGANGGPSFLRLADGSGWLFDSSLNSSGKESIIMEPVPVESGLWSFYVDNDPVGIALRNHPIDDGSSTGLNHHVQPKQTLPPQQKIYCDKKVVDGSVTFYRVQGSKSSWVFDKRDDENYMLVPEHSVRCGLVAYQISSAVAMRITPYVGEETKIPGCTAWEKDLVVGDYHRLSPCRNSNNGPFVRLTNGMGWLFEYKYGEEMMKEVFIETGTWHFKVQHQIQLRKQPIDEFKFRFATIYPQGEILTCDRQIVGANGVKFYRVKGTTGWVFDKRETYQMLTPCSAPYGQASFRNSPSASLPSWTIDFVRGVAIAIDGIHEISLNEQSRVISFSKDGAVKTRINVYYTTRTIGTALNHPNQGKSQLFRRECTDDELAEIMRNPRVHTDKGYKRKRQGTRNEQSGNTIDAEEEMRSTLLEVDDALATLEERRRKLVSNISKHDSKRCKSESETLQSMYEHVEACQNEKRIADEQRNAEEKRIALEKQRAAAARELASRTCKNCNRVFGSVKALNSHFNAVHVVSYQCQYCYREFNGQNALNQHCDATGHW